MKKRSIKLSDLRGVDNKRAPESLMEISRGEASSFFVEAKNVDFTGSGGMRRRRGFSQVAAGDFRNVWSDGLEHLVNKDGWLCRFNPAGPSFEQLLEVGPLRLSFASSMGTVYFSNGQLLGKVREDDAVVLTRNGVYTRSSSFLDPTEEDAFFSTPPPGEEIEFFAGRLWVANKDALWYSEAFFPERCDMRKNYMPWTNVRILAFVRDGLYVGTDREIWFLRGTDPKAMQPVKVASHGVVSGTKCYVDGTKFKIEGMTPSAVAFETPEGKVLATDGGRLTKLTEQVVSYAPGSEGATYFREDDGNTALISSFPSGGEGSNMRTSDVATAEIVRNGITI